MNQQILIIDDSEKIHPLVKAILADEPVDIHSATDPKYGLTLAASMSPDLILLDIDMPGMDGFEACRQLKAGVTTSQCPIIFLSSHAAVKDKVHGFGLGAVDYVTKPFHPTELLARMRASLHTHYVIRSLEETATIDPLTGLGSRTMFVQRIEAEICLRDRCNTPLSIILMDVDQFRPINEIYGHAVGDQVLEKIGKIIAELCRTEDVPCRFGGEEFVIIAPHTTGADAFIFAERIRERLADARIKPQGISSGLLADDSIRVTASFGVAEALIPYDRKMLQRADDAMYRAKEEGRNRVAMASLVVEEEQSAAA